MLANIQNEKIIPKHSQNKRFNIYINICKHIILQRQISINSFFIFGKSNFTIFLLEFLKNIQYFSIIILPFVTPPPINPISNSFQLIQSPKLLENTPISSLAHFAAIFNPFYGIILKSSESFLYILRALLAGVSVFVPMIVLIKVYLKTEDKLKNANMAERLNENTTPIKLQKFVRFLMAHVLAIPIVLFITQGFNCSSPKEGLENVSFYNNERMCYLNSNFPVFQFLCILVCLSYYYMSYFTTKMNFDSRVSKNEQFSR